MKIQSITVHFAGGEAKLVRGKEINLPVIAPNGAVVAEVSWPLYGRHILLRNAALSRPVREVSGPLLVIARTDQGEDTLVDEADFALEWLTGRPIALAPPRVDIPRACADFATYYAGSGPPHYDVPLDVLLGVKSVRPWPDSNVTASTGSGRLVSQRVPAAIAALLLHERGEQPSEELLFNWERDVERQWLRGCHPDLPTDDPLLTSAIGYQPWVAHSNPEWICSRGYTTNHTTRGGFWPLYSHKLPPGVDFNGSGDIDCDRQHFAIDQQILAGVLLRNVPAVLDAFGAIQSAMSLLPNESWDQGRGKGHLMRACALFCHAFHKAFPSLTKVIEHSIGEILDAIEEHMFVGKERDDITGPQRKALALDKGDSTDSYHIKPETLSGVLGLFGKDTPENRKEAAKSMNVWWHGILVIGLDEVLAAPLPEALHVRALALLEIAAHALLVHGSGPAFELGKDGSLRGYKPPPAPGFWDDVAFFEHTSLPDIPAPLGQGGIGESGIYARFVDAPLRAIHRRLGKPRARELADKGLAYCNGRQNWNGDYWDWFLECGLGAGSDHGRADVRDVKA